ncbi:MAG: glucan biosynthesis protein [Kiloniellales bacterium]
MLLGGLSGALRRARAVELGQAADFSPDALRERAKAMAATDYEAPPESGLDALRRLSYDQLRDIRFRAEETLWRAARPFQARFYHIGSYFLRPVRIFEVADCSARELLYTPELFDFGANQIEGLTPESGGFAGLRLHSPLNRPDVFDEVASFLGASYFRAIGRNQHYGLSARGMAINTGMASGEEFPAFTELYLERPALGAESLVLHALLDSPSTTGAYRFEIQPGSDTVMQVSARVYPRREIARLGIAPLTSMYSFGANDRVGVDDFRPAVHDSEGLAIWTGEGERIWRPLVNPEVLRFSFFGDENPRGFGLMQRTRRFAAYQDLEARYDLRPSLWVEPLGAWGKGTIQLIEIPSDNEAYDNIVAYWIPAQPVTAGTELVFDYRLHWSMAHPFPPEEAIAAATLVGRAESAGDEGGRPGRKFVIDFTGGALANLDADAVVEARTEISGGTMTPPVIHHRGAIGGWRVFFNMTPAGNQPVELRCRLVMGEAALSETWAYQWTL